MRLAKFSSVLCVVSAMAATLALSGGAVAGDAAKGEKVFRKCKACHAVGEDAANRVGPQLNNLLGRAAGSVEGFAYSDAMIAAGEGGLVWDEASLAAFLSAPKSTVPGTKMTFAGLKKDSEIDDVLAYLKTFGSESAEAEEAEAGEDGKATETAADAFVPATIEPPEFTEAFLDDPENFEKGKEIWFAQCTHCHGYKAYPGKAPKLKPAKYKPSFVYKRVAKGFKKMPSWRDVYTTEEIMAVVAYVKSKKFSP